MTGAIDPLIIALLLENRDRFIRAFSNKDFSTSGGLLLYKIIKRGQSLDTIDLVAESSSQKEEAWEVASQAANIDNISSLIPLILKKVPLRRILADAAGEGIDIDIPRLRRKIVSIEKADLGEGYKPKPREWDSMLKEMKSSVGKEIPTGFESLDRALEGGGRIGEANLIMSPTNRGKTLTLCAMGSHAAQKGIPVLHLSISETSAPNTLTRYTQNTLQKNRKDVLALTTKYLSRTLSKKWKAPLRIIGCRGADTELARICQEIYKFPQGLVLVDAMENVKDGGRVDSWKQAGDVLVDLRDTAAEKGSLLWTTLQTNRTGFRDDRDYDLTAAAESIAKVWAADVVISLQQGKQDIARNVIRLTINKSRERDVGKVSIPYRLHAETQSLREIT